MTRSSWGAATLLAATFLGGVIVGGAAIALAERGGLLHAVGGGPGGRNVEGVLKRLTRELDLDRGQQDSVRSILVRHQPGIDSIWKDVGPRLDTLRGAIRADIRAVLTPDQQRQYTEMLERQDAERHRMGR